MLELLPLDARRTAALRVALAFATRAMHHARSWPRSCARTSLELQDAIAAAFAEAGVPEPAREAMLAIAVTSGLAEPLLFGDGTAGGGRRRARRLPRPRFLRAVLMSVSGRA